MICGFSDISAAWCSLSFLGLTLVYDINSIEYIRHYCSKYLLLFLSFFFGYSLRVYYTFCRCPAILEYSALVLFFCFFVFFPLVLFFSFGGFCWDIFKLSEDRELFPQPCPVCQSAHQRHCSLLLHILFYL